MWKGTGKKSPKCQQYRTTKRDDEWLVGKEGIQGGDSGGKHNCSPYLGRSRRLPPGNGVVVSEELGRLRMLPGSWMLRTGPRRGRERTGRSIALSQGGSLRLVVAVGRRRRSGMLGVWGRRRSRRWLGCVGRREGRGSEPSLGVGGPRRAVVVHPSQVVGMLGVADVVGGRQAGRCSVAGARRKRPALVMRALVRVPSQRVAHRRVARG